MRCIVQMKMISHTHVISTTYVIAQCNCYTLLAR